MLTDFVEDFQLRYQDILSKALVAMKVANTRLESGLKYGDKAHRFKLDLTNVLVRTVTPQADRTIDPIADSDQTLDVDKYKGASFAIDDWEAVQAGPLAPGLVAGREIALKVRRYIDADVLTETLNAFKIFDTGNLTTMSANGTPIVLSTTNVPVLVTRLAAVLQTNNVPEGDWCMVVDPYTIALFAQHAIGKELQMSENILQNGYSGNIVGFKVYSSNNLTARAVLTMDTNPTNGDTITINGIVFTFESSLSATAGSLKIGTAVDDTRLNLTNALNAPGTAIVESATAGYTPVSTANQNTLLDLRITATNSAGADTMSIVAIGSGRLTLLEGLTAGTNVWTTNYIDCFVGKVGAIDAVVQKDVTPDLRQEPKQKSTNVLIDAIYGVKTFDDGAQLMIDLKIDSA